MASAGYRLKVLGTHYRPHASPAGSGIQIIQYTSEAHHIFTGGANLGYLYTFIPQFFTNDILAFQCLHAPEVLSISNLNLAIFNKYIDRFLCFTLYNDSIKARQLKLSSPVTSSLRLTKTSSKR